MARKVFFSFYYDKDVFRVSQVRNSNVVTSQYSTSQFLDHADWESVKRQGDAAIKKWIDSQLEGTITCVLIGSQTYTRPWVKYEIEKSIERKNALLGIYIHNMKSINGQTDYQGRNPMENFKIGWTPLTSIAPSYDWVYGNGYQNFGQWIEHAVQQFKNINHFRGA